MLTAKDQKIIDECSGTDEPIFVFRAKDKLSLKILLYYRLQCGDREKFISKDHVAGIKHRIVDFEIWQTNNPDKTSLPD